MSHSCRSARAGKIKLKSVKIAMSAMDVRLCAGHVRGNNSPSSGYVMKEFRGSTRCTSGLHLICVHVFLFQVALLHQSCAVLKLEWYWYTSHCFQDIQCNCNRKVIKQTEHCVFDPFQIIFLLNPNPTPLSIPAF